MSRLQMIARHKWSAASGVTTVMHCAIIYGVIEYLYQRDRWHPNAVSTSTIVGVLAWIHFLAFTIAVATAIKGVIAEKPRTYAFVALIAALPTLLIYVG